MQNYEIISGEYAKMKPGKNPMSGEDIAVALNITRQAVSNSLKRAMKKCYNFVRKNWPELSPLSASIFLMKWLDNISSIEFSMAEIKKFHKLFPPDVRQEIALDVESKRGKSYFTILETINDIFDCMDTVK